MSLHHPDSTPCSFFAAACPKGPKMLGKELGSRCQAGLSAVGVNIGQHTVTVVIYRLLTWRPFLSGLGILAPPLSPVAPALAYEAYGVPPLPIVRQGKTCLLSQLRRAHEHVHTRLAGRSSVCSQAKAPSR
jgi:hypothetical protein